MTSGWRGGGVMDRTHGPADDLSDRAGCTGALARALFGAANRALSICGDRQGERRREHGGNDLRVH